MKLRKLLAVLSVLIIIAMLLSPSLTEVCEAQFRKSTTLSVEPATFTVKSGESINVTATLTSDGAPLADKPIEFVAMLGTVSPNIAYTDANGKATVTYSAPIISVRTNVSIIATFAGDLVYEGSTATIVGTIEPGMALQEVSLSGASFIVPETLKDDVESYKASLPSDLLSLLPIPLPKEAFILANPEGLYLVLSDQCDEGYSSVEGWKLPKDIALAGINLGVVVARSASFEKEGAPATISDILANPESYAFKLVKINSNRRQVSILYDPDEPPEIEFPVTVGYLTEKPLEPLNVVRGALDKGAELAFNADEKLIGDMFGEAREGLKLFNFKYEYWYDCQAITNGIVIPANHSIFKLLQNSLPTFERFIRPEAAVALYDVKTDIPYVNVSSVTELKENADKYVGKTVRLIANVYGGYISVQEIIEHNTPCSEDYVYVENVGCVNLIFDVRLEGLIAWNNISVPPKRDELLLVTGVSSFHQDEQFVNVSGVFEIIGKVISTRQISESLPEGAALLICKASKIGEIDFEGLAETVKQEVKDRVGELYYVLQDLYPYTKPPAVPFKIPNVVYAPKAPIFAKTPAEIPQIYVNFNFTLQISVAKPETPINLSIINSTISNVSIMLNMSLENVRIFFEKLIERPPNVPEPPGLVWAYFNINTSIPYGAIDHSEITFWILKEWLATHGGSPNNVVMLRYHERWQELPTSIVGENATHYKFVSETLGFSIFAITVTQVAPAPTGVEGYISDYSTGTPISGAKVAALSKVIALPSRVVAEATTDEKGHYSIELPPGVYVLVVSVKGYVDSSANISLTLGEVRRVDFALKAATAEFYEDWGGVKFEVALITNTTWEVCGRSSVEVSITVADMGENLQVEFGELTLEIPATGVKRTMPINAKTDIGGTVFTEKVYLDVVGDFSLMAPETSTTYPLDVDVKGSVTDSLGVSSPGWFHNSVSIRVSAPPAPLALAPEVPAKVVVGEEFSIKLRIRNDGKLQYSKLELKLVLPPAGVSALNTTYFTRDTLAPSEEIEVMFRLKAESAVSAQLSLDYSYRMAWSYLVIKLGIPIGTIAIGKIPTSINVSAEPEKVNVGEEVLIKGSLTPTMSAQITLTIKKPDGTTETQTTTSGADGTFSFKVKLDREGEWAFIASYNGDPTHEPSTSPQTTVQAVKAPLEPWLYAITVVVIVAIIITISLIVLKKRKKTTS